VPDGVGVKSYLYTGLIRQLRSLNHEVQVLHDLNPAVIREVKSVQKVDFKEIKYTRFLEPLSVRFMREVACLARLSLFSKIENNKTIILNWMPNKRTLAKKLFYFFVELIAKNIKTPGGIDAIDKTITIKLENSQGTKYYKKLFSNHRPDLIFCTHQRVPEAVFPIIAAQKLGIATATTIFSWDNLPKARLNIRCDYYFVWSLYMKNEFLKFYPDIKETSIIVSGTPQFNFYRDKDLLIDRENFAQRFGLDASKYWICFSGDDHVTSPHDPIYLEDIAESLSKMDDVQILFREVPTESISRYQNVLEKYKNIFHVSPEWEKSTNWVKAWPRYSDLGIMSSLAAHCLAVCNIGSTMAHDFAVNDKPCFFINYDVPNNGIWTVKNIYQFQHFRSMGNLDAVGWIQSREDWYKKMQELILHPTHVAKERRAWYQKVNAFEVLGGIGQYVEKLTHLNSKK